MSTFLSAALLFGAFLLQVSAQYILKDEELQILRDNGYTVTINEESSTVTYEHHGVPIHTSDKGWGNPSDAQMVNHSYTMPLKPTVASEKGCAGGLGVIGLAVSGGAFYNPYTGFGWNAVEGECAEELDNCRGHPSPDGTYHYHGVPDCLMNGDLTDKFLGVALDGYPIYGPMNSSGINMTSADLDICHGHEYNGRYVYRATYDFPYIISCFHGEDVKSQRQNNGPTGNGPTGQNGPPRNGPPGMNGPPDGQEDSKCWQAKYQDWATRICHVVCENAGQDLEECPTDVTGDGSTVSTTTVVTGAGSTVFNSAVIAYLLILTNVFRIISL